MKPIVPASFLLVGAGFLCVSCGGSVSISNTPTGRVRALNDFVDVSRVSANASGTPLLRSQAFGFSSLFIAVKSGTQPISFFDASSNALLASRTVQVSESSFYDAVGLGSAAKGRHVLFMQADQTTLPGQTKVRIVNGDEDDTSLDIYITPGGTTDLTGRTPQETAVQYADDTAAYLSEAPGSYTIWFTPPGKPATLLVGANETFVAGTNLTLLLLKGPAGLTVQQLQDSGA